MANICSYKVLVKGRKNGCYAFYGSMQTLDGKSIIDETGTDEDYKLRFESKTIGTDNPPKERQEAE